MLDVDSCAEPGMKRPHSESITRVLRDLKCRDEKAARELLPVLYDQLHAMARSQMGAQRRDHTLQPTALVNEAYVRIFRGQRGGWESRKQFLGLAARVMRSILVDHARSKGRLKRECPGERVELRDIVEEFDARAEDLQALDESLRRMARFDPELVKLVELRFFAGRSMPEIARLLDRPLRSVERDMKTAKAWLRRDMK